jgi:hypothetical protein
LALTSPTSGGHSVGIVRWRTKTAELFSGFRTGNENIVRFRLIGSKPLSKSAKVGIINILGSSLIIKVTMKNTAAQIIANSEMAYGFTIHNNNGKGKDHAKLCFCKSFSTPTNRVM